MNNIQALVLKKFPNAKLDRSLSGRYIIYDNSNRYSLFRDTPEEAWFEFYYTFVAPYEEETGEQEYLELKKQVIGIALFVLVAAILLAIFTTPAKAQYRTKILNRYEYKQKFPDYQDGTRYQPKPRYTYKNKKCKK